MYAESKYLNIDTGTSYADIVPLCDEPCTKLNPKLKEAKIKKNPVLFKFFVILFQKYASLFKKI